MKLFDFHGRRAREFVRRKSRLMRKGRDLHIKCNAEVYIAVRQSSTVFTYSSAGDDWPPSDWMFVCGLRRWTTRQANSVQKGGLPAGREMSPESFQTASASEASEKDGA